MRHPLVEFVKFLAAIVLLCLTRNPYVSVLFLILEFVIAPSVKSVLALLGMTALSVIVNALVNHQGETYLFYLNDNIVTMESLRMVSLPVSSSGSCAAGLTAWGAQ